MLKANKKIIFKIAKITEANTISIRFSVLLTIFAVLGIGGAVTYIIIKKNKSKKEKGDK